MASTVTSGGEPVRETGLSSLTKWSLVSLGIALFAFLVLLPLSSVFGFAFEDGLSGFLGTVTEEGSMTAFRNSLYIALMATIVNALLGTLMAWIMTRYRFFGRQVLRSLIDLPIAIPTAVVGLSLMMLYGPMGLLGPVFTDRGFDVVMAMPGIILAHIFVTFPFTVRSVSVALEGLDPDLEDAARTLGSRGPMTFLRVVLPSIRGGIIAGSALTFTRSLGEFGATLFIAGGMVSTGPLHIYYLSDSRFDYQAATSVAVVLMVFPFLLLLVVNYLVGRMEEGA